MSRRITAGNDAPFRWAVKLQGKPFDLSGKDVKVYVINSRGDIPVARLTIEGHEVSGVFEGRYQTRLGEHSLVLRVNEGRPEMKTATVANVFELVQWSADAGGSDEGDVIVAPVLIESELSIGGGSSYDDTEVKEELARLEREKADKSELTELSAEVGKKQDTITDLETIRSGAEKGATAIQEVKTINGQSIVGSGNIEIQGGGGGGASTDKQGVIRQTQKWTQAADKGYDYVMQNIVRGAIPQANIDLFISAGAVFNEESGYFELNGLTDISYEEMSAIYNAGFKMAEGYWSNNIRTNIFRPCNVYNADAALLYGFTGMYANRNCKAESFKFTEQETYGVALKNQLYGTYEGCIYLKTFGKGVFFCQDTNIANQAFTQCYSLETIYLRNLKKNVWFKDSARLSIASVLYMVAKSAATSAIVITLHADTYAKAMADTEIQSALEAHPNVSLASA